MNFIKKLLSKSNDNLNISLYLGEEIKSHLRKKPRYEVQLANLKTIIRHEFNQELDNNQLVEILKLTSENVYGNNIRILLDNTGLIASIPLSLCAEG